MKGAASAPIARKPWLGVITEIHRVLLELGLAPITHLPGNAKDKGKTEAVQIHPGALYLRTQSAGS